MMAATLTRAACSVASDQNLPGGDAEDLLELADRVLLLRCMLLMRAVEDAGASVYKKGIPGSFSDGRG